MGEIKLIKGDCYELVKEIPDNSIDLVIIDPPYQIDSGGKTGELGHRKYHDEYVNLCKLGRPKSETERKRIAARVKGNAKNYRMISLGFENTILDELCRVMKKINIYIWCSKGQLRQIIDYFDDRGCNIDLLTWHKNNPIPTCNGTYMSDTEYCVFAREGGVKLYGDCHTKRKWYASNLNVADKKLYGHPTIKPLQIIQNFVINSSVEGDTVLDCFMGSGTTGVACRNLNRNFIGIEIDPKYFEIAQKRLEEVTLF